jgi:hypothetical protein
MVDLFFILSHLRARRKPPANKSTTQKNHSKVRAGKWRSKAPTQHLDEPRSAIFSPEVNLPWNQVMNAGKRERFVHVLALWEFID